MTTVSLEQLSLVGADLSGVKCSMLLEATFIVKMSRLKYGVEAGYVV